ncbi:PREDICTED: putative B3 domain-containing protein Os03g0621600 isoform X2 [Fragaria vesca subsp. vesca]|uniref:putative B3 domain-containing protein Os03g0621600 isoform X2 n=1 Tax=Fragaria vesca subsp. vesca TaxID=101020 RepID=UPI0002C32C8C|nr:PREDICTED: putative B3 domain-containing protein Os03g0621600 isoform X2 [Fragaria vesca subsp. vesca]
MVRIPTNGIEEKNPSFFKIILPGRNSEYVRIPRRFVQEHIVNKLPKMATLKLKRSSEYSRNVKVKKSGEDVFLKDGWLEFMRDACLGDKEFLVFIYTGKMHFSVKVYDKNACERMVFPEIKTHQNTTSSRSTKRPCGRPRKSSIGNSADVLKEVKEDEEDCIKNTEKSSSKSTEMPTSESRKRSPVRQKETTSRSTKRPRGRPRKYPVTYKDSGKYIPKSEFDVLREVKEEEVEYQESGELMKSELQYFTSKIHRLSQVYMCKPFYVENLSSRNYDFLFLKNSEGTEWYKVTLSRYRDTAFMTKGWHAFAVANQVKVGSLCQFHFLKENKIVVHILNS